MQKTQIPMKHFYRLFKRAQFCVRSEYAVSAYSRKNKITSGSSTNMTLLDRRQNRPLLLVLCSADRAEP